MTIEGEEEIQIPETYVDPADDPKDPRDQMEMFLFKFPDIGRDNIKALLDEFMSFAPLNGELEETKALRLLEKRNETKTALELRTLLSSIDHNHNKRMSFLEWATCFYAKDWKELHKFTDRKAYERAMEQIEEAKQAALLVEREIEEAKKREEEEALRRAKELEEEAKLEGVAGKAAFFRRQIEQSKDSTSNNITKIKEEASRRKQLREAKIKEAKAKAVAENAHITREAAEKAMAEAKAEADRIKKEEEDRKKAEEKAKRDAFIAKQRLKWEKNAEEEAQADAESKQVASKKISRAGPPAVLARYQAMISPKSSGSGSGSKAPVNIDPDAPLVEASPKHDGDITTPPPLPVLTPKSPPSAMTTPETPTTNETEA